MGQENIVENSILIVFYQFITLNGVIAGANLAILDVEAKKHSKEALAKFIVREALYKRLNSGTKVLNFGISGIHLLAPYAELVDGDAWEITYGHLEGEDVIEHLLVVEFDSNVMTSEEMILQVIHDQVKEESPEGIIFRMTDVA